MNEAPPKYYGQNWFSRLLADVDNGQCRDVNWGRADAQTAKARRKDAETAEDVDLQSAPRGRPGSI